MSFQQWGQQQSKKRGRDDDGDVAIGGTEGFTEHRNKRLQSLPFRTSPTTKKLSFQPSPSPSYGAYTAPATHDMDSMDMDMEDTDDHHVHHVQDMPAQLNPGHCQPDPMQPGDIASRMPTPIHCSFAAQVRGNNCQRGNNWSGAAGNVVMQPSGFGPPPAQSSVPRSLDRAALVDWNMVQNRRLPSPISESGGEELGSPRMKAQQHPGMPPRAASAMEFSPHTSKESSCGDHTMDVEAPAAGQTPPKKGHTRSRHTLNNWTQVPGMKKSFSIGFRTDCEKCRQKVPGHFNHIIVS